MSDCVFVELARLSPEVLTQLKTLIMTKSVRRRKMRTKGRVGRRTAFMEKQREVLKAWMAAHPEISRKRKTLITSARLCWLANKNEWNTAAHAVGSCRGYSTPRHLARSLV